MTTTPRLRIAIEFPGTGTEPARWVELTESGSEPTRRLHASTLADAQRRTSTSSEAVFVDLDVLVADSVSEAYDRYRVSRPGWAPGTKTGKLVHPGTADTLAGLLSDIAVAGVADGVTLTADDAGELVDIVYSDLAERLTARGTAVRLRPAS